MLIRRWKVAGVLTSNGITVYWRNLSGITSQFRDKGSVDGGGSCGRNAYNGSLSRRTGGWGTKASSNPRSGWLFLLVDEAANKGTHTDTVSPCFILTYIYMVSEWHKDYTESINQLGYHSQLKKV